MPSTLSNAWVKNVYNLRTAAGKNGGLSSTFTPLAFQFTDLSVDNHPVLPSFVPAFSQPLSTTITPSSSLLNMAFTRNPQSLLLLEPNKRRIK